jgi:glycosyltransferase involved in cell wall biosynthesis
MTIDNKLEILMFGWEFPPFNSGGLGTACHGLTHALAKQNAAITFVLPRRMQIDTNSMRFVFADSEYITIHEVDSLITPYINSEDYEDRYIRLGMEKPSIYGKSLFEEVYRYSKKGREIAKKEKFDVIHSHDWLSFGAGIEAKKVSGKPLIAHIHATEFDRTGNNSVNSHVYNLEKHGMQMADKVIAVSNFTKEIIVKKYGIPAQKITVVHNAITPGRHHSPESHHMRTIFKKIVLFVGRLTLQKGPDIFLRAAQKVLEVDPTVAFIIAGAGDMERQVVRECAALGISDKVFFTGFLRGEELNRIYQAADLYVMPSISEPFGITVLEALNNGTPVLVSKQSGVSEVLTHVLKVDFWDVDEMTNKIMAVLNYKSLKHTLREHGTHEVGKLSWDKSAAQCLQLYRQCVGN